MRLLLIPLGMLLHVGLPAADSAPVRTAEVQTGARADIQYRIFRRIPDDGTVQLELVNRNPYDVQVDLTLGSQLPSFRDASVRVSAFIMAGGTWIEGKYRRFPSAEKHPDVTDLRVTRGVLQIRQNGEVPEGADPSGFFAYTFQSEKAFAAQEARRKERDRQGREPAK